MTFGGDTLKFVQPIRDENDIEKIKNYFKSINTRNYVMFCIGIYTALRASDIIRLQVKDVRETSGQIKGHIVIVEQKTRTNKKTKKKRPPRTITMLPQLHKILKEFVKNKNDDDYIIKSRKGDNKAIRREMVYRIVKKAADKCQINGVGSHTMRKTFAYHYYQKTNDIAGLMKMLGHSKEEITLRYIGLEQDNIDENMMKINY